MLKIRLQRVGKRNRPSFRIVVTESKNAPKSGAFLEILGWHDRIQKKASVKADRVKHWISKGVQISPSVHNLLISEKIIEGRKIDVSAKKKTKGEIATAVQQPAATE